MYLARTLNWNGRSAQMVGAIPGDAVMHARPVGRGYVRLQETADFPWPRDADAASNPVRLGHEFHHSSLENLDPAVRCAYRVQRGHGIGGGRDGVLVHNVLASYAHLRHTGGNDWPRRFMAFVRDTRERRVAAPTLAELNLPQEAAWSTP
jgi:cobyrinic acid a,c-diamide synthase